MKAPRALRRRFETAERCRLKDPAAASRPCRFLWRQPAPEGVDRRPSEDRREVEISRIVRVGRVRTSVAGRLQERLALGRHCLNGLPSVGVVFEEPRRADLPTQGQPRRWMGDVVQQPRSQVLVVHDEVDGAMGRLIDHNRGVRRHSVSHFDVELGLSRIRHDGVPRIQEAEIRVSAPGC